MKSVLVVGVCVAAGCSSRPSLLTASYADEARGGRTLCDWLRRPENGAFAAESLRASEARGEVVLRTVLGGAEWGYAITDRVLLPSGDELVAIEYTPYDEPVVLYRSVDPADIRWVQGLRDATLDAVSVWPDLAWMEFSSMPGGALLVVPSANVCVAVPGGHLAGDRIWWGEHHPLAELVFPNPAYKIETLVSLDGPGTSEVISLRSFDPFGQIYAEVVRGDSWATFGAAMLDAQHPFWERLLERAEDEDEYTPVPPGPYVERVERLREIARRRGDMEGE